MKIKTNVKAGANCCEAMATLENCARTTDTGSFLVGCV